VCLEHFPAERVGDLAIVTLPAEVDISSADLLREDLLAVIDHGAAVLIVDLSGTRFCDSAALSALIVVHRQAAAVGARLRLVVGSAAVLRVMSVTGVDQLFDLYPSLADAHAGRPEREPESVPE
jgi:anti-sigma B factor antagonist